MPIDFRHGILPDRITLPGIVVGIASSFFVADPGPRGALFGALTGVLVPLTVRALYMGYATLRARSSNRDSTPEDGEPDADEQREGMGLGDVKMLAMVGAFLGAPKVLLTMLLGSVIGTLWVLPLLLLGRIDMKAPVPFGPFLGVAAILSMYFGSEIIAWYFGLSGIPAG